MTFDHFIQILFGFGFAAFGYTLKFIMSKLDEGFSKMAEIEKEVARQQQQTKDMARWMSRIEEKVDLLVEREMRKK